MALRTGRSRLPELLEKRKMQQNELARKLGVTEGFISQVKNGDASFSYEMARNAAKILRCRMEHLHEWIND